MSRAVVVLLLVGLLIGVAGAGCIGSTQPKKKDTPPVAVITTDPPLADNTTFRGLTVGFTGAKSTDKENDTLTYHWSFGDGSDPDINMSAPHIFQELGDFTVTLTVTEKKSSKMKGTATMLVHVANRKPVVERQDPVTPTVSAVEGGAVTFVATATDSDGETLTYSWAVKSIVQSGATTLTFAYRLDYSSAGNFIVQARATDGRDTGSVDWNVTVAETNRPPVISSHLPAELAINITEGTAQEFTVSAQDLDADPLTYKWLLDGTPVTGATSDSWTLATNFSSAGNRVVRVEVSDGKDKASVDWTVLVVNSNRPPVINSTTPTGTTATATENMPAVFAVDATDPDNDALTYSWAVDDVPIGGATSKSYSWKPSFDSQGPHALTVTVRDVPGATVAHTWTVTVSNVNRGPVLNSKTPSGSALTLNENQTREFSVNVTDPDGDAVTYAWTLNGTTIPGATGPSYNYTPGFEDFRLLPWPLSVVVADPATASVGTGWNISVKDVNRPPTAAFVANRSNVGFGVSVGFNATSSSDPDLDVLSFSWAFGDAATGIGETVAHTYLSVGVFTVVLTVRDKLNVVATANTTITVSVTEEWISASLGQGGPMAVEDIDNDGTKEIIAGVLASGPESPDTPGTYSGFLYIFNGITHAQEFKSADIGLITDIAVGNIDGDPASEIVVGTWTSTASLGGLDIDYLGYARAFDSTAPNTYAQAWESLEIGRVGAVAVGNHDGAVGDREVAVSSATTRTLVATQLNTNGNLRVYAGSNGALRFTSGGQGLAMEMVAQSVDADATLELVYGTRDFFDTSGFTPVGSIHVWAWVSGSTWAADVPTVGFDEWVNDLAIGDVDKDGSVEIVIGTDDGSTGGTYNGYVHVWPANLTAEETTGALGTTNTGEVLDIIVADFDKDTVLDIILGTRGSEVDNSGVFALTGSLWVFDGSTQNQKNRIATLGWVTDVAVGDLDEDPKLEIIAGGVTQDDRNGGREIYTGSLSVFTGASLVKPWSNATVGRIGSDSIVVNDADGDLKPDFTLGTEGDYTDPNTGAIRVYENGR